MKVEFFSGDNRIIGWLSTNPMPVPRVGDFVDLGGKEYEVVKVLWICANRADLQVVKVES